MLKHARSRSTTRRLAITGAIVTSFVLATAGMASAGVLFNLKWGDHNTLTSQMNQPNGVAVDTLGNVYVADTNNDRIQKFTGTGGFVTTWGSTGTADGQFNHPKGIAVDANGNVYVADTDNNRIQSFNSTGSFIAKWGSQGAGASQFSGPIGIGVNNTTSQLFIADTGNNRIVQYSTTGSLTGVFASGAGSGPGQFNAPTGVAVDSNQKVLVTDTGNNRIQRFLTNGSPDIQFGTTGSGTGQFTGPTGIALDSTDRVFVADTANNRMVVVNATLTAFIQDWDTFTLPLVGVQTFSAPRGVALQPGAAPKPLYVADTSNQRIVQFDPTPLNAGDPTGVRQFGTPNGTGAGQLFKPRGVAVNQTTGDVYVVDSGNRRVQRFDANGAFNQAWSVAGANPAGIAIAPGGDVFVTDSSDGTVSRFTATGTPVLSWGGPGSGNGQFLQGRAGGIAVDPNNFVYVADVGGNRVEVFNSAGTFQVAFGSGPGTGDTQFNGPLGIANRPVVGPDQPIYVTDTLNNRVVQYSVNPGGPTAAFVRKWGIQPSPGSADGQFDGPAGIAADAAGNIYVTDVNNQHVQKFSSTGTFLTKFASAGSGDGQVNFGTSQVSGPPLSLAGIAINTNTNSSLLYIGDIENNRVQRFGIEGDFTGVPPFRLLDTRNGTGLSGAFTPNQTRELTVVGVPLSGIPATGVDAVLLNVTALNGTQQGHLTVFPTGQPLPNASNLNFAAGQVVPNLVAVKVGAGGKVSIANTRVPTDPQPPSGSVDVLADVVGWYSDGSTTANKFTGITPNRILDTRTGSGPTGAFTAHEARNLAVSPSGGGGGVPAGVDSVVMNVTVTQGQKPGHLTVYPAGTTLPNASNLNFSTNQTVANLVVAKVGAGGEVTIANTNVPSGPPPDAGTVQVIVDVVGYYRANVLESRLTPITPQRLVDTRNSPGTPVPANGTITVDPSATVGLPPVGGYTGVVVNVTAVNPTQTGHLTVYPSDASLPLASNLNFTAGAVVPNLVMVKVGADGKFKISNTRVPTDPQPASGTVHVLVDIVGFYTT